MGGMSSVPSDTVIRAWTRLVRSSRIVLGAVEAELKAAGFPPLGWYDALLELSRDQVDGLRPFVLEERLLLAQYNLSRVLDRLEEAGYVERLPHPEDRRGQIVRITTAGRDLVKRMWPAYRAAIARHVGAKLDEDEARDLASLLDRLIAPEVNRK
jgi:DNA-binding MarR family transcriptional regulator